MQKQHIQTNLKLTYFDLKGRAESSRLALHMSGIPFIDERLSFDQFLKQKSDGVFKYKQIPVLYVEGEQYAQQQAIMRYVGRLTGLYPQNIKDQLKIDQALSNIDEIRGRLAQNVNDPDKHHQQHQRKVLAHEKIPEWLNHIDDSLKDSETGYFIKDISIADLELYTTLSWIKSGGLNGIPTDLSAKYERIEKLYAKIKAIPKVQEWNKMHKQTD